LENTYEGTQNFKLAGKLKACLEAKGFTVLLTRNAIEEDPSLEERGKLAGDSHACLFLSIHSNAPGPASSPEAYHAVRGAETYYSLADVERNAVIARALETARRRVTDGTSISGPLASSGVFPRLMTDMLAVGEQAGDMAGSLEHIGRRYQKDMDRNITAFTNALEPLLIVLVAGIVGFLAVAILMAVFKASSSLG
jgi:N-acetylmuramoyl-L-alanine amidase